MSVESTRGDAPERRPPATPHTVVTPRRADDEGGRKKDREGKKKKKKKEDKGSARGVETMFRTSYRTHVDMSSLADSKANIMISINGLVLSVTIAGIAPRIATYPLLLLPTVVLLVTCLISLVYAVLAARPRVSSRKVTLEEVRNNRANILFFGNFVNMPEADYVEGMTELLGNPDVLYSNMIRDIYSLGGVLARKFRLLRISYTVFMAGLVVGFGLFILAFTVIALRG